MRVACCKGDCHVMQKAWIPEEACAVLAVQMGLVWSLVAMTGGVSAWKDLLPGKEPYGATYAYRPQRINAFGT